MKRQSIAEGTLQKQIAILQDEIERVELDRMKIETRLVELLSFKERLIGEKDRLFSQRQKASEKGKKDVKD